MALLNIITGLLGLGGSWLENRSKIQATKAEGQVRIEVARAEAEVARLNKSQDAEINWDQAAVDQMKGSWKDEWWTLLVSLPLVLAFLGEWGRTVVTEGFVAIQGMPDWYIAVVFASVAASFGIKALVNRFGLKK